LAPTRKTWRSRIFEKWGALCHDHAGLLALIVAGATAFFAYFAFTIEINLGFLSLLEQDDPLVRRVEDANDNFGGLAYMNVALVTPADQPADKDRLIRYANLLTPKLQAHPDYIERVIDRIDVDGMIRWAPLFMESEELESFIRDVTARREDLAALFADIRLAPFLARLNAILENLIMESDEIADEADALRQLRALDDFYRTAWRYLRSEEDPDAGAAKHSLRKLLIPVADEDAIPEDDHFFFDDGRMLILRVMPVPPADDYTFCEELINLVNAATAEVDRQVPGVRVLLAGNPPVMRDEHRALVRDMRFSTIASLALVLIIFAVVFRRLSDLALIAICLVAGLLLTFGATYFTIGYLNLLTAFFAAIMIGLGIDFGIHLLSRYGEGTSRGLPVREAIIEAIVGAGPGVVTGGATTAAAFLALTIARFKGLAQLGFVSGVGILLMLLLMFTLLPALICLRDRRRKTNRPADKSLGDSLPLGRVAEFARKHARAAGLLILLPSAAAVYGAVHFKFNYDYRSLEPRGAISMQHIHEVERRLGRGIDNSMIIVDSLEECRHVADTVAQIAAEETTIDEVESIADFIPREVEETQDAKNRRLRTLQPIFAAMRIERRPTSGAALNSDELAAYRHAVRQSRQVVKAVLELAIVGGNFEIEDAAPPIIARLDEYLAYLEKDTSTRLAANAARYQGYLAEELAALLRNLQLAAQGERLTMEKLPDLVKENFIGKDGRLAVYLYPKGNIWHEIYMERYNSQLRKIDPNVLSLAVLFEEVVNNIKADFQGAIWYSLAAVFLLVLLDFRRLTTALLALFPLIIGSLWMVGVMPLLGIQFNLVNVAIVPLILGIGVDNGVHILHRYRAESSARVRHAVEHTGKAILLSSLTTTAGFGTLALASYVAIGSLGQLLAIGVTACLFTSVFALPIVLSFFEKRGWKV